ncbi:hypothetical protein LCGC14_1746060 [marine sediment metagenome]|uniref:Uncharacterized protein n=1 Tax=marine sediment metagenome TaxID=412755 RepID=A0A0F9HSQ6_9ZZZZ
MKASIQWLKEKEGQIGVFRCGEGFDKFGDPYEMVSTIQHLPDGGVHMFGVQSTLKVQLFKHLREIRKLMRQEGIKYIIWEKLRPDGTMKNIRIDIKEK